MSTDPPTAAPSAPAPPSTRRLVVALGLAVAAMVVAAVVATLLRSSPTTVRYPAIAACGLLLARTVFALHRIAFPPAGHDTPPTWARAFAFLALVDAGVVLLLVPGSGGIPFVTGAVLALVASSLLVSEGRRLIRTAPLLAAVPAIVGGVLLVLAAVIADARLIVGGAVLVVIAMDLGAAWVIDRVPDTQRRPPAAALVGAVAAIAIGFGLMVDVARINDLHAALAIGVLVLLAAAVTLDGDALVLVLAVGGLILVAGVPTDEVDLVRERQAVAHREHVLVLGDSFTSGEGSRNYLRGTNTITEPDPDGPEDEATAISQCRRSPGAWALLLAARGIEGVPSRVAFEACSGDVTEDISDQVDRYRAKELGPPALVVIGVGGNDVGFSDIGTACIGPGDCADVAEAFVLADREDPDGADESGHDLVDEPLEDVADDLERAFEEAVEVAQGARVVAVPYPIPVRNGSTPCFGALLSGEERDFIATFVRALNETIHEVATEAGIEYLATMEDAFAPDLRLCDDSGERGINFIAFNAKTGSIRSAFDPSTWIHNSFHPNGTGHEAMARAAETWFRAPTDDEPVDDHRVALTDLVGTAGPGTEPSPEWRDERLRAGYLWAGPVVLVIVLTNWWLLCHVVAVRRRSPFLDRFPPWLQKLLWGSPG